MNEHPEDIVRTTLEKLLDEKLQQYAQAEEENRPTPELNALYQQIKVLRHKIGIIQQNILNNTSPNQRLG